MPKPLIEDLPYPDLSELKPDCENARHLMPAYADAQGEMTAILQYIFHSLNFEVSGDKKNADLLKSIAIAEMGHLDLLGEAFLRMDISPTFVRRPPSRCDFYSTCNVNYSTVPAAMLSADITSETEAIRTYEQILCKLTNPILTALVSRILLDEKLHLERLKTAYKEIVQPRD